MTIRQVLLFIFCFIFMTGCSQTIRQHSNMINAMNRNLAPIDYNQTYIYNTFGEPDKKTVSDKEGVHTEVWTYITTGGGKDLLFNMHPKKARYMRITITNGIVADVSFE